MVKKIRILDEIEPKEVSQEQMLMDTAKAIDWKLWEIMKIMQKIEKKLDSLQHTDGD